MTDLSDPIAILRVSAARRLFGTGCQIALGLFLIQRSLTRRAGQAATLDDPSPAGLVILIGIGLVSLWQATRFHRATQRDLVLTREGLFDSEGEALARMEDIASVDRGAFAFKPSNGFMIHLKDPAPRGWVPGLWWRIGRRVGVGGATSGKAARDLADVMTLMLAERAGQDT